MKIKIETVTIDEKRANIQCGLEMTEPIEPAEFCGTNFAIEEKPPKKQCVRCGNSDMRKHIIVTGIMVLDSSSSESEDEEEDDLQPILSILLNGCSGNDMFIFPSKAFAYETKQKKKFCKGLYGKNSAHYSEEEFRRHIRISRQLFENLCDRLSNWKMFKK